MKTQFNNNICNNHSLIKPALRTGKTPLGNIKCCNNYILIAYWRHETYIFLYIPITSVQRVKHSSLLNIVYKECVAVLIIRQHFSENNMKKTL